MPSQFGSNLKGLLGGSGITDAKVMTVVGLGVDASTVVAVDSSNTQRIITCLDGYRTRAPGDTIIAAQLGGGSWVVIGKPAADNTPVTRVMYGNGSPVGPGWRKAAATWVYVNPDGSEAIYTDMTGATPAPATVAASEAGSWMSASGTRGNPSVSDLLIGAWYYGASTISGVCSGKTVSGMSVRILRDSSSGANVSLPVRLGLHSSGTWGQPTVTNVWDTGVSLALGQYVDVPIPAAQYALLASGSARGLAAMVDTAAQAMTFLPQADITITFSA